MAINVNNININTNYNIKKPEIKREYSGIKMSQTLQATGNVGYLIPIFARELIPSQKININFQAGLQFRPFVTNLLHNFNGQILTYFVPYRLLWDEWEDFITGGKDGMFTAELPNLNKLNEKIKKGGIEDFLGFPLEKLENDDEIKLSIFPRQAYNLIWNEQLRNLDIQEEIGLNQPNLLKGLWDFDYFNTARIMQMRGLMPTVPVAKSKMRKEIEQNYNEENEKLKQTFKEATDEELNWLNELEFDKEIDMGETELQNKYRRLLNKNLITTSDSIPEPQPGQPPIPYNVTIYQRKYTKEQVAKEQLRRKMKKENPNEMITDGLGININELITTLGITRYQVNNMRTKPRYMEQIKMRFGISPTDERMQLPEYIGINTINVQTNAVTQTAPTTSGTQEGVGNITGQAFGIANNQTINYMALEWGIIMSLMIIKPTPVYELGAPKMWTKKTKFDFATPELTNILDVPIYKSELNYSPQNRTRNKIFGWTSVYDDYRTTNNIVANDLRPSVPQSMSTYTLAMKVPDNVELNSDFISCTPDMKRIKQYTNQDDFVFYTQANITTAIPLPLTSDPNKAVI